MLKKGLRRLRPKDKRLRAIFYTALSLFFATIILIIGLITTGYPFNFEKFWEPIFISWICGAALFVFSIITAVIQLDDPSEEGASRRLEILFQGKEGPHIDYFRGQLRTLEQFAEISERRIVLKRLSEDQRSVFVEVHTKSVMRNFIDDVATSYSQPIGLSSDQAEEGGVVAYLRIDGKEQPRGQFGPGPNFSGCYAVKVPQGRSTDVEFGVYRWVRLEDNFDYTPAKYLRKLCVYLENEIPYSIAISIQGRTIYFENGERREIFTAVDLRPRERAYTSTMFLPQKITKPRRRSPGPKTS